MRVAPLLTIAAALTFAAIGVAEAQTSGSSTTQGARKRVTVDISKRSPLDAGTVVKPGSKSYLDYALPAGYFFPTYGAGSSSIVPGRYPLPGQFDLPGY
ncbi:MAG: hypothetical protein B7Z15_07460 [Rhizobiales bacterium 32-66-8]|nr:MAG: hypothetical protein B7Z15_07460 [Rhizobiales bacterium 32-66-8]